MISDEMKEQKRINQIKKYRMKRDLCQSCGGAKLNTEHICVENYVHTDMTAIDKVDLIKKMAKEHEDELKRIEAERIEAERIAKHLKIKEEILAIDKKEEDKRRNFLIVKYTSHNFSIIENISNYIENDFILHIAKVYRGTTYLICDEVNPQLLGLLFVNKIHNIFVKKYSELVPEEYDIMLKNTNKIYTNKKNIIDICKENKIKVIALPSNDIVNMKLIREKMILL